MVERRAVVRSGGSASSGATLDDGADAGGDATGDKDRTSCVSMRCSTVSRTGAALEGEGLGGIAAIALGCLCLNFRSSAADFFLGGGLWHRVGYGVQRASA